MTAFCNRVIDKALANNKLLVTSYLYKSIGSVMQNETKYYPYSASFTFTPVGFSPEKYCRLKFNLVLIKKYGVKISSWTRTRKCCLQIFLFKLKYLSPI